MEKESVSERIARMVNFFSKGNKSAFAKQVGISNQSLGEIVGARQSTPSFAALQKILIAFPEVRIKWLVLGRGAMLTEKAELRALKEKTAQFQTRSLTEARGRKAHAMNQHETHPAENRMRVLKKAAESIILTLKYAVINTPPGHPKGLLLSTRLSISEEDAEQLVLSGRIKAKKLTKSEGYRVSEKWVRKYLASDFETPRRQQEHFPESGNGSLRETLGDK